MADTQSFQVLLAMYFSPDELRLLCSDIDINPDHVPKGNSGLSVYAFELVRYVARQQKTPRLLDACKIARPHVDWNSAFSGNVQTSVAEICSRATQLHIRGDLAEALAFYEQVKALDPLYPRINSLIREVEAELKRPYVNSRGVVGDVTTEGDFVGREQVIVVGLSLRIRIALTILIVTNVVLIVLLIYLITNR